MKTLKIEKEVTKEDVYVMARTPEELAEVERMLAKTDLRYVGSEFSDSPCVVIGDYMWYKATSIDRHRTEITIPQLAELLGVEYPLKPEQLPTLEELIEEARRKMEIVSTTYPCWVDGTKDVTSYHIGTITANTSKGCIAAYVGQKVQELL